MARTIGKIRIAKLKSMVFIEVKKSKHRSDYEISQKVILATPEEWFDRWESAWSEINRIISDTITEIKLDDKARQDAMGEGDDNGSLY